MLYIVDICLYFYIGRLGNRKIMVWFISEVLFQLKVELFGDKGFDYNKLL